MNPAASACCDVSLHISLKSVAVSMLIWLVSKSKIILISNNVIQDTRYFIAFLPIQNLLYTYKTIHAKSMHKHNTNQITEVNLSAFAYSPSQEDFSSIFEAECILYIYTIYCDSRIYMNCDSRTHMNYIYNMYVCNIYVYNIYVYDIYVYDTNTVITNSIN